MNPTTRYEYLADMARIDRMSAPDISDRSYLVTATFDADKNTQGVILAWGSLFGGFVIYVKNAQLCYEYVYSESLQHTLSAALPQQVGRRMIQLKFERTGRQAGRAILIVDGITAAAIDIPAHVAHPRHHSRTHCGQDAGAPISGAYERPFRFTGRSLRVTIELESEVNGNPGEAFRAVLKEQ